MPYDKEFFIPPKEVRELRDPTRTRTTLIRQRAAECNRIQKLLENTSIKLASVASNILGKSGRAMPEGLAAGRAAATEASWVSGRRWGARVPGPAPL